MTKLVLAAFSLYVAAFVGYAVGASNQYATDRAWDVKFNQRGRIECQDGQLTISHVDFIGIGLTLAPIVSEADCELWTSQN